LPKHTGELVFTLQFLNLNRKLQERMNTRKAFKFRLGTFALIILFLYGVIFFGTHDYHPSTYGFCANTQTRDWVQDGPWEKHVAGNAGYLIDFNLGSPYDKLDPITYPDRGALGSGVTRFSLTARAVAPMLVRDDHSLVPTLSLKAEVQVPSAPSSYDFTQAVLEVDGRQYQALAHAWQFSPTGQRMEVTSPSTSDQYFNHLDFAFPVEVNLRSRIQLLPGSVMINGASIALPVIDYHYCPHEDYFTHTTYYWH
jgi:hypothetical protein